MDHVRRRTASTSLEWLLLGSLKRKRKRNTRRNTLAQHCSAVPKYMFWASSHTFHSLGGSGRFWALSRSNGEQWCEHRRNWDVLGPSNTRTSHRTFLNYHTAGIARVLPCLIFVFFLSTIQPLQRVLPSNDYQLNKRIETGFSSFLRSSLWLAHLSRYISTRR